MDASSGDEQAVRPAGDRVVVRGRSLDRAAVTSLLRAVDPPRIAWATGDATVAGGGAAVTITARGPGRIETVRSAARDLLADVDVSAGLPEQARPRLFGGLAFHESFDGQQNGDPWGGFPGAMFVLPAVQLTVGDAGTWLTTAATGPGGAAMADRRLDTWARRLESLPERPPGPPPGVRDRHPTPDKAGWDQQVTSAVERVRRGDLRKVVLAQALSLELESRVDAVDVLARLGRTYPDCYRFLVQPPGAGSFFGATPERLVALEGDTVRTLALAGSIGRGETADEDEWLAGELENSEKESREHDLVVEAIRDQLGALAETVSTGERSIRKLATVQHLQTPIEATLHEETHVLDLVDALHPTPAVGGLPPAAALQTIRETETFDRGWYAAPVGWVDGAGDGTFAVALRSAVARDRSATLFAGDGLVADSDPDAEWDELGLKYRPVLDELE